ncbi:hypothetical protein KORDIASMS9_03529 [Kordia sp. SMS9]|uniref:hypothetical protein n=1 Tax=Kordia sp. SMS9 TaxID=2282170 RepID=UPI000E0D4CE0|nr:hypothetical protein [Kordia sp. SMS9]AXG71272.1 hypothetical protein KORDIASMS9_03529 [Kordia sp. SMS9]
MKKRNLSALKLNKKSISKLHFINNTGGNNVTREDPCPVKSERGPCYSGDCVVTGDTLVATCAEGCTRPTVELSYCNGGIPDTCQSVQVCA